MMTCPNVRRVTLALLVASVAPASVVAQRAEDNAVTAAQDAFGIQVDQQVIGLYSPGDARGFSPQQAGNLRIEGLYFDQETLITNPCLVRETAMRIGIAAQSFSFPSPTGIADLKLRVPGETQVLSALLTRGPLDGETVTLEAQVPLAQKALSVDLCGAYYRNFDVDSARQSHDWVYASTVLWRPTHDVEVIPFGAYIHGGETNQLPAVYTDGSSPLPSFSERALASPNGTAYAWHQVTGGAVTRAKFDEKWTLAAGLFFSEERDPRNVNPYLTVDGRGLVDSLLDVVPPFESTGRSGELRLARRFTNGHLTSTLALAFRGRITERQYGGDQIVDFGTIELFDPTRFSPPAPDLGAVSLDSIHQVDAGVTLEERWSGAGSVAIGVLKDDYERTVQAPPSAEGVSSHTTPWRSNERFTIEVGPKALLYGSYLQGLEDSPLAPLWAVNRGELPAASLTWQGDAGVRISPTSSTQVILGAFEISKPYLNIDGQGIYRVLGQLHHRGIESSVSFSSDGLTLIAGGVWLQPRAELAISGSPHVEIPLGPVPLTLTANLDVAPRKWKGWAASGQVTRLSSRDATNDGSSRLPSLTTVGAGGRYEHKLGAHPWSLRLDAFNLTNAQGLHVSSVGQVLPERQRRFVLTLAVDY